MGKFRLSQVVLTEGRRNLPTQVMGQVILKGRDSLNQQRRPVETRVSGTTVLSPTCVSGRRLIETVQDSYGRRT